MAKTPVVKIPSTARPASRQRQRSSEPSRMVTRSRRASSEPVQHPATRQQRRKPKGLATVDEQTTLQDDGESEVAIAADDGAAEGEEDAGAEEVLRPHSVFSAALSATATTSFSKEEADELDAEIMLDVLPSLVHAADDLVKLLLPSDPEIRPALWREICKLGSKQRKLYNIRVAALSLHKRSFTTQEFVQPRIVLRALLGFTHLQDAPTGPWRPDSLIYAINLAQMLRDLLITVHDPTEVEQEGYNALATVNTDFPTAIAGREFDPRAIKFYLAVQTQFALMRLAASIHSESFQPMEMIRDTFYDTDGIFRRTDDLHLNDISDADRKESLEMFRQLAGELMAPFNSRSGSRSLEAVISTLRSKFPWKSFLEELIDYYEYRKNALEVDIAAAGGVDAIVTNLSDEVQRREDARTADQKRQTYGQKGTTPKRAFGKGAIAALKAREKKLSDRGLATRQQPTAAEMASTDFADRPTSIEQPDLINRDAQTEHGAPNEQSAAVNRATQKDQDAPPEQARALAQDDGPQLSDDEEDAQPQPTPQEQFRLELDLAGFHKQQKERVNKGKAKSFIDRQSNAERVSFEDTQPSQPNRIETDTGMPGPSTSRSNRGTSGRSPGKRTYEAHAQGDDDVQDFDPTQDEGFDVQIVDAAAADERRRHAPQSSAPPRHSSAEPIGTRPLPARSLPARTSEGVSKRKRANPGSSIPPPPAPQDPDEGEMPRSAFYSSIRDQARRIRPVVAPARAAQVRTTWTAEEEARLGELIEDHGGTGVSYATLKSIDDAEGDEAVLSRRSAEDLRFKARNMKFAMLRARFALPPNWENVVLDRKLIDRLQMDGVDYDQHRLRAI